MSDSSRPARSRTERAVAVGGTCDLGIDGDARHPDRARLLRGHRRRGEIARGTAVTRAGVRARRTAFNLLFVIPGLGSALLGPFPTGGSGRLAGGMFDENSNGTLLAAITLLALTTRPFGRVGSAGAAAVRAGLLLLTFSRTAYAAFLAGLLAYLVLGAFHAPTAFRVDAVRRDRGHSHRPRRGRTPRRRETLLGSTRHDLDARGFFHLSLDYFKANPLFGAGFGAARQQIGFVIHSTFFALLGEAGVLARLASSCSSGPCCSAGCDSCGGPRRRTTCSACCARTHA